MQRLLIVAKKLRGTLHRAFCKVGSFSYFLISLFPCFSFLSLNLFYSNCLICKTPKAMSYSGSGTCNKDSSDGQTNCISETALELFRKQLTTECTLQRQRKSYLKYLNKAKASDETSTPRLFLEAGTKAAFAYYAARRCAEDQCSYRGKANDAKLFQQVHTLPVEDQISIAKEVNAIVPHTTVQEAMMHWSAETKASMWLLYISTIKVLILGQDRKRRRESPVSPCQVQSMSSPGESPQAQEQHSNSAEEPASPDMPGETALPGTAVQDALPKISMEPDLSVELVYPGPGLAHSEQPQILSNASVSATAEVSSDYMNPFSNASVHAIADIFPEYVNTAIIRHRDDMGWAAAVNMYFPELLVPGLSCRTTLAISHSTVGYLAVTLFKVNVEANREVYQVVMPGGARVAPTHELSLQGAQIDGVREVFGSRIFAAISGTFQFQDERQRAIPTTACVSMNIPSKITSQAHLNLDLELKAATLICQKLYTR